MKTDLRVVQTQRKYSDDFKLKVVREFEKGTLSVHQLCSHYCIAPQTIYNWIYKFSTFNQKGVRIVEMKDSNTSKLKEMEQRIRDLERMVGQKQISIDYLEKMIDLAKTELDIDIKKNYGTPQSGGSGKTGKR